MAGLITYGGAAGMLNEMMQGDVQTPLCASSRAWRSEPGPAVVRVRDDDASRR